MRERLTEADRAVLAADLLRESEQRQQVKLGRWSPAQLLSGRIRSEDAQEGLATIQRRAQEERTPENLRDLGVGLGQLTEAGLISAEASAARLVKFVRCTGTGELEQRRGPLLGGMLDGQASVRRARDRGSGGVVPRSGRATPRRRRPAARSLLPWSLRDVATGGVTRGQAEVELAKILGRLDESTTSRSLSEQAHAIGQLHGLIDLQRAESALEAAGRRAGIANPGRIVRSGLALSLQDLDRALTEAAS